MADDIDRLLGRMQEQHDENVRQHAEYRGELRALRKDTESAITLATKSFDLVTAINTHMDEQVNPVVEQLKWLKTMMYGVLLGIALLSFSDASEILKFILKLFV